jgi:hypothetical protein
VAVLLILKAATTESVIDFGSTASSRTIPQRGSIAEVGTVDQGVLAALVVDVETFGSAATTTAILLAREAAGTERVEGALSVADTGTILGGVASITHRTIVRSPQGEGSSP